MSTPQKADALSLSVIDNIASFEQLQGDWSDLMPHASAATVFMQWEWHFTWWQVFARKNDSLHIMTWRKNGRLVGVLPLYKQSSWIPGTSCLHFIGTGETQIDEVATEYGDLLVDAALEAEVVSSAVENLLGFDSWQNMKLMSMLQDSLLATALEEASSANTLTISAGQRYRVALTGTEEDYLSTLGKSRAKRIKRSQRAIARDGEIKISVIESSDEFDQAFRQLAELNHERQDHKQRKSVFASTRFNRFHHELCLRLYTEKSADIVRFHLGSRLLAVLYCFYDDKCCYYYQSGFVRKDANRFMPLTVAHLLEMQRSRDAGRTHYDLMRGRPPCYKDEYACETQAMVDISVFRSSVIMCVVSAYRSLRSTASRLLKR